MDKKTHLDRNFTDEQLAQMFIEETLWQRRRKEVQINPFDKQQGWIMKNTLKVYKNK